MSLPLVNFRGEERLAKASITISMNNLLYFSPLRVVLIYGHDMDATQPFFPIRTHLLDCFQLCDGLDRSGMSPVSIMIVA